MTLESQQTENEKGYSPQDVMQITEKVPKKYE